MGLKLLLVDDDTLDREAVKRALRAARVEADVIEEANPAAAIDRAREGVDCLLLDYQLPGTDGLAILRELRTQGIDVPVIALTGYGDEQTAVDLMKAGAADYLSKQSLTPDRLERSLRHALALAAAERERRQLLGREQLARQEAQTANRVKDEFLATLSHELRTPLNAILGWTRLLATGQLDEQMYKRGLETIERNVRLQVALIDDLLDISRIVTGKLSLEHQPVSFASVVRAAVESQRLAAESAGVNLTLQVEGDERLTMGDSARLQQVVTNLLSNAIKFTPAGGRIDVSLVFAGTDAVLTVRDTGIGIDPEFLPYIFERFRQADSSTTRAQSGLGLGLAIVKHLVETHGGRIAAESAGRGAGATFRITLPTAAAAAEDAENTPPCSGLDASLSGLAVLLVDDDADSREMMRHVLQQCGATVVTASNAAEAIACARTTAVDVVVTDIAMPGVDGYELLRELRALWPSRAVVAAAVTAYASSEDRDRAVAAGFSAHIAKPCDPHALVQALAALADDRSRKTPVSRAN